jgi:4-diphosphocytidyl-2-C-methyl-D-erythritol kinase
MAERAPGSYVEPNVAEDRLAAWMADEAAPVEALLFNNMEAPAFEKFIALPELCGQLESRFGLKPHLSGSGSACFTFLADDTDPGPVIAAIRDAWGQSAFVQEARLA